MLKLCRRGVALAAFAALAAGLTPPRAEAACCYFSAKDQDILQPGQKAFITWDPQENVEDFTVQPKFEGNALDFGMVIPTPSRPKLHEMPRDFFKHLAVFSILKRRESPQSKLLPQMLWAMPTSAPRIQFAPVATSDPHGPSLACDQGSGGGRGRLAGLQDHRGGPGRRPLPVAQGPQVHLLRRRGHAGPSTSRRSGCSPS